MRSAVFPLALAISLSIVAFGNQAEAQAYAAINTKLKLYCVDLPDDTTLLARVTSTNGQINTLPVDPDLEAAAIRKVIKQYQKKIATLRVIKRENDPTQAQLDTVRKVLNFVVNNDVFQPPKPNRILESISKLIGQLKSMIDSLENDILQIEACLRGELPPAEGGSPMVINYPFIHPDYNEVWQIFGVGFLGFINKKATYGDFCVSAQQTFDGVAKFPKETHFRVGRNACIQFYPSSFRKFPFVCGAAAINGNANTVVGIFDPAIDRNGPSASSLERMESLIESVGPINVRPWTKKTPCRTK
jgi:hypothetical protein